MSINMGTSPNVTTGGRDDRSIGELLGELVKETATLVQQEITLAKTEMSQKISKIGADVGALAVGGAVLYAGLLTLIAAIVLLLALWMPAWVSALIVGLIVTGAGAFMLKKGLDGVKNTDPVPHQTIETLKEDQQWAKSQIG
jgi:hypothetical protein